jgi:hypothetical protein
MPRQSLVYKHIIYYNLNLIFTHILFIMFVGLALRNF